MVFGGEHAEPALLECLTKLPPHDGVGFEVVLDYPQWQAAKHFAQSDTLI